VRTELGAKVAVWLGLAAGICVPYFGLQRIGGRGLHGVPATFLDRWIDFEPGWIGIYLSICVLVPLAPALATTRDSLLRYAKGLALLCTICFAAFWLVPIAGPRPVEVVDHTLYQWVVQVDRPSNSMPSLHAGLAAYSLLFIDRTLREDRLARPRILAGAIGGVWAALIFYSTLATKQHWALDLPAGVLAAWVAQRWAWRDSDSLSGR